MTNENTALEGFTPFTEASSDAAVNARMGADVDPRLRRVMESLVRHLHGFIREVELTGAEWEQAVDFLTRTGKICSGERQEFILLSDVLGASMLVDAINNRRPEGATENTVFGPFHVADAPIRAMGEAITLDGKGEPCLFEGRVLDLEGRPIAGACVDVWSDNADGYYDVQQPGIQPKWNNRGRFITGADGRYAFTGIRPISYPIPDDGPVGQMLAALGRHPMRPAHMHYLVSAPGFEKLVTHTFVGGDEWLASDAVFGVKPSLVACYEAVEIGAVENGAVENGAVKIGDLRWRSPFDFVLVATGE